MFKQSIKETSNLLELAGWALLQGQWHKQADPVQLQRYKLL